MFELNSDFYAANDTVHGTAGYVNANSPASTEAYVNTEGAEKGLGAELKTFYDKALIELMQPKLVHSQFGQKRDIPKGGGKTVEFRQFNPLAKATTPITEGVTPTGNKLTVVPISATVEQYGDYVELTDQVQLTSIDPMVVEATKAISAQAGKTVDTVVRDVINTGTNVIYSNKNVNGEITPVSSRADLDQSAKLCVDDVFRAAALLRAQDTPTMKDGSYVAIVHPYAAYDLMKGAGDSFIDVAKYCKPEDILAGEIGKIGGVRFVQSSEAKIFKDADSGKTVFSTLVLGENAYGCISAAGGGVEHIVKPLGYGNDPLNQRSSVGWKGMQTAKILVQSYMVRIESGGTYATTALSAN